MKKIIFAALCCAMAMPAVADVTIEMKGFTDNTLKVMRYDLMSRKRLYADTTCVAKNGVIVLPDVKETARIKLTSNELISKADYSFYVGKGENMHVVLSKSGNSAELVATGTEAQAEINKLSEKMQSYAVQLATVADEAQRNNVVSEMKNLLPNYVKENPNSPAALWALAHIETEEAVELLPLLGETAKNSIFGPFEGAIKAKAKAEADRREAMKNVAEGCDAPDFALNLPDGSAFVLSSLRGMWVILDFWGTWCPWCIKGIPQMKENYKELGDRLEIVSIACRDSKEAWLEGIKKYDLNWVNVISEDVVPGTDKKVEQIYAVEGYPTKIVIDPKGKIAMRCVGERPEFYDQLKELMK